MLKMTKLQQKKKNNLNNYMKNMLKDKESHIANILLMTQT